MEPVRSSDPRPPLTPVHSAGSVHRVSADLVPVSKHSCVSNNCLLSAVCALGSYLALGLEQ